MKILYILLLFIIINWQWSGAVYAQTASPSGGVKKNVSVTPTPTPLVPKEAPIAGINLSVSPVFINLATDPGVPVTSQLSVRNNSNVREYLQMRVMKFEASKDGDKPVIAEVRPEDEFVKWIEFSNRQFTVDPNQEKPVKFTISPPKTAALGYYYALVVERIQEGNENGIGTVINGAPAVSVLLNVRSPLAKKELQLVDFKTDQVVYEYLPVQFAVTVKNTGNIHVVPTGDIFIDWGGKKEIAVVSANEARGNILPQTQRTYYGAWDDGFIVKVPKKDANGVPLKDAAGRIVTEEKWDFGKADRFRIGKYTAHLLMVYDNGQRDIPIEATTSFWVLPWKIMVATGVALIFILLGIKLTLNNIIRTVKKLLHKS